MGEIYVTFAFMKTLPPKPPSPAQFFGVFLSELDILDHFRPTYYIQQQKIFRSALDTWMFQTLKQEKDKQVSSENIKEGVEIDSIIKTEFV